MAAIMGQILHIRLPIFALIFLISALPLSHGVERKTHNMIYYDVEHFAPCVRRFNATHQIGCTSEFNGNNGVIHFIQKAADLEWLLANGTYSPYITLMTPEMFNIKNVKRLLASRKVNGMMVDHTNATATLEKVESFSTDKTCPNEGFGLYSESAEYAHCSKVTWNPNGNSMSFMDFGIPVFALTDEEEVKMLIDCYEDHNRPDAMGKARPFPQCAAEMYDFMFGAKDTPTCAWRTQRMTNLQNSQYCDPMGDYNVIGTVLPTNKSMPLEEKSLIVAAAQLDATGLFYRGLPISGAENTIAGFVTLLAAAQVIGNLSDEAKQDMTNIMFTFFQGETYDYIGSSRMVYDMNKGEFPVTPDDEKHQPSQVNLTSIAAFLEVRQLALPDNGMFYAHTDPLSQSESFTNSETTRIQQLLGETSTNLNISFRNAPSDDPLPPASFQQFLKNETNIPGVVITDHLKEFKNMYYNSRLDLPEVLGVDYSDYNSTQDLPIFPVAKTLTDVATTVARTLYLLARPNATDADTLMADEALVNDLMYCFNQKPNCSRLQAVLSPDNAKALSNTPYDLYVGVSRETSSITYLVSNLLGYYLGSKTPMREADASEDCKGPDDDKIFSYYFIGGPNYNGTDGLCVKSTTRKTLAVSPAFDAENYAWDSTVYSTWTESQWSKYYVRAFLKPSRNQESVTFSIGMIFIIISLTGTYFISKRIDDLFP